MANSIRTPRQGKSASSRRIAQAVDDEDWQEFRVSLKGRSTQEKLDLLLGYYENTIHSHISAELPGGTATSGRLDCDVCIRVDNYIKALCRGGQLRSGIGLLDFINGTFKILK